MNEKLKKQFDLLKLYTPIRDEIMDVLSDADLAYQAEGLPSVGEICVQIGEWQRAYIEGLRTFEQGFEYRSEDPERLKSVAKLKAWYAEMDAELEEVASGLSDEDVENKPIERGGWQASAEWSVRIWQECLIIFYTKMMMIFKLMGKELPEGLKRWIE